MAGTGTACVQSERDIINLPLEVKAGGMPGEFEGYGAVFGNIDRDGDVVTKGAFADSLKERLPALLWQHNPKEPIGRFDMVREDAKGLFVKGRLSQTGKGAEAYELLKMGALNGLSIGFVTKEAQRSSASGARQITRADLMEVSLVTFPANELARVQTVKQREPALNSQTDSEDPSIRDPRSFERFLRENGFSRSRAKAITAKGFKGVGSDLDIHEIAEIITDLKRRQLSIEYKRSSGGALAGGAISGVTEAITSHILDRIKDANIYEESRDFLMGYAARNTRGSSRHTFRLSEGETRKLVFPISHNTGKMMLTVLVEDDRQHRFRASIKYPEWTSRSVAIRNAQYNSQKGRILQERIEVGSTRETSAWLASPARSKLRQAQNAVGRGRYPLVEIKYLGLYDSNEKDAPAFQVSMRQV